MSRAKSSTGLKVLIPNTKFDSKPFSYFLGANSVEFYMVDDFTVFATLVDRMNAVTIWKTLTGSEVLGRHLDL